MLPETFMRSGYFWGTTDVDPGEGEFILSQYRWTTMVLKIDPDGDLIWGKQMGSETAGHAYGCSIAVDNSGNVIHFRCTFMEGWILIRDPT
ncbi:MAG: hypothetical protein MZV65_38565 [Chromatiales bacterium]|nr:hypothetical protein [Chromatiales bacterium]